MDYDIEKGSTAATLHYQILCCYEDPAVCGALHAGFAHGTCCSFYSVFLSCVQHLQANLPPSNYTFSTTPNATYYGSLILKRGLGLHLSLQKMGRLFHPIVLCVVRRVNTTTSTTVLAIVVSRKIPNQVCTIIRDLTSLWDAPFPFTAKHLPVAQSWKHGFRRGSAHAVR